jgi:hypothetical protein
LSAFEAPAIFCYGNQLNIKILVCIVKLTLVSCIIREKKCLNLDLQDRRISMIKENLYELTAKITRMQKLRSIKKY